MTIEGEKLSVPPSFAKSAGKLGWQPLNFRVSQASMHLVQGNFRLTFLRIQGDEKMWSLEIQSESGWHNAHMMRHPEPQGGWGPKDHFFQVITLLSEGDLQYKTKTPVKGRGKGAQLEVKECLSRVF